ncbi:MAG: exodeoxyribonuclease III [Nitriliruptoraceae bacterium]
MRLVSWNVNSIRARLPRVEELLAAHTPDVVCLQETKVADDAFPHDRFAEFGYHAVTHSEGRWNGVAVLVRAPLAVRDPVSGLPGEPNPAEARWVEASVDGVRIVSVYVPNGRDPAHEMFDQKLGFLAAARDRLAILAADGPVAVAGDFNVAPTDRDVWDPSAFVGATHVTFEERAALAAIVDAGFTDAYRALDPEEPAFTWWDYRMGAFRRGMGMRIDLALTGGGLQATHAVVDTVFRRNNAAGDKPSDHAPLIVELQATSRASGQHD